MQHHHHDGNDEQDDDEEVGLTHPSFLLMMPNVWLKFQAPIAMGMVVVVAPTAIATSHVHIEKKEKMRE